jgi:hypothetical protein
MTDLSVSARLHLSRTTQLDLVEVFDNHDSFCIDGGTGGLIFVCADSVEAIDRFASRLAELRDAVAERRDQTTPPEPKP